MVELAEPCRQSDNSVFEIAAAEGWISWKPLSFGGTRRNFLKEAASRVYEDKIARTYAEISTRDLQRQQSKQRMQKHINEIRRRKSDEQPKQVVRMSQERPMSVWSTVMNHLTRPHPPLPTNNIISHIPFLRSALANEVIIPSAAELPATETESPAGRTVAQPLLPTPPPSTVPSHGDRQSIATSMPSIEEHPANPRPETIHEVSSFASHSTFRNGTALPPSPPLPRSFLHLQESVRPISGSSIYSRNTNGSPIDLPVYQQYQPLTHVHDVEAYESSMYQAIYRIVEMGFTAPQAQEALRATSQGAAIKIDRAIELLLSVPA